MQIPILSGIRADETGSFRTAYPRNMKPVPTAQGISVGYLKPAEGVELIATGQGLDRGGIVWRGQAYRVQGSKLVRQNADDTVTVLGDVGGSEYATLDYSFDVLGIASGGKLHYWDGASLTVVTDPDIGYVKDVRFVAGYWLTTDGEFLVVTELNDRYSVNPLKYGSVESNPDDVIAVDELKNEIYAFGRYTIEIFQNVGGDNFPFQRIEGAQVAKGAIGTHSYCQFMGTFAFMGGAENEPPAIWIVTSGNATKLSSAEVDTLLLGYTETQLQTVVIEARLDRGHQNLMVHLPDQCLVYDGAASQALGEPAWYVLTSSIVGLGQYRARTHLWAYDKWTCADPTTSSIGALVDTVSTHYGAVTGWEFGTLITYNEGRGAVFHELELVGLPGRVVFGLDPVIWTSYSLDGETWSQERLIKAGRQGERLKRMVWRKQGKMSHYRIQRFRGTSDARISLARLEATIEPLAA